MAVKLLSGANFGLKTYLIEVEVDIAPGLHSFTIVGLPDTAINESRQRVNSAIKNSGLKPPKRSHRLTVNLAPANLKKQGPAFDLPIALGFLMADKQIKLKAKNKLFVGELSLQGDVRPIQGVLSIALKAQKGSIEKLFVPEKNALEANMITSLTPDKTNKKIKIFPVKSLKQLIDHLRGAQTIKPLEQKNNLSKQIDYPYDFSQIKGQESVKRALEISATGRHNLLMMGPPGSGKTLLAKGLPSILPPLTSQEKLSVSRIYSLTGKLSSKKPIINQRPFRSPHHSSSQVALVGGGGSRPKPGEISLAHKGVLFLDEFPEFSRQTLEALRGPLEDKKVAITRSRYRQTFPSDFMLIAAMNPCPCGFYGEMSEKTCQCTTGQIQRYRRKISGPLLDRIDLQIEVPPVDYKKLTSKNKDQSSEKIRKKVKTAWQRQLQRQDKVNALLKNQEIDLYCQPSQKGKKLLKQAMQQSHLSARGYHRLLKLARTIADLEGKQKISQQEVAEALQYRLGESFI